MTAAVINGRQVILLNADMNPLSKITLQKAARLLALEKALVHEGDETRKFGAWIYPLVIKLKEYIYIPFDKLNGPPRVSKRGVLIRDDRKCVYCRGHATTIDHVHPRSRSGKNTWQNLAAACLSCNHKKGNRTAEEAGMKLLWQPYVPKRNQLR